MPTVNVMNKQTHIFDCELDEYGNLLSVGEIVNERMLPICLQGEGGFTKQRVAKWMTSRLIPENRVGMADAVSAFKLTVKKRNMFSLSDQYWFRWNQKESWARGNYFTNSYNTDFGRIFFSPWSVDPSNLRSESPDQTTNGVLQKRWVRDEATGISTLTKKGDRAAHQEPISEVLASMTLQQMNLLPFVKYELVVDGLKLCCACKNFITADTEFVPAAQLFHREKRDKANNTVRDHLILMTKKYAPRVKNPEEYLDKLAFIDDGIGNDDRHIGNLGFIRSALNGDVLDFAPIFDSGSCFGLGEKKDKPGNRLFSQEEVEASISRVSEKNAGRMKSALREAPLLDVIDSYPTLTTEEKAYLTEQVKKAYTKIKKRLTKPSNVEMMEIAFG